MDKRQGAAEVDQITYEYGPAGSEQTGVRFSVFVEPAQ